MMCVLAFYKVENNTARQETKTARQLCTYLLCMSRGKILASCSLYSVYNLLVSSTFFSPKGSVLFSFIFFFFLI